MYSAALAAVEKETELTFQLDDPLSDGRERTKQKVGEKLTTDQLEHGGKPFRPSHLYWLSGKRLAIPLPHFSL